jgi:hypothetical protein
MRVPCVRPCRLSLGEHGIERSLEGFLCNVSQLGVYVAVDPVPEVGDKGQITFALDEGEPPIEAQVEVAWRNVLAASSRACSLPQGCGLRFTTLTARARERIGKLIEEFASILRGETPVVTCASCGRIYLAGSWQRRDRLKTQTRPTHGICPDCAARLYPDLLRKILSRRRSD